MADLTTTFRASELARSYSLHENPSYNGRKKAVKYAEDSYTFAATPSANDNVVIGTLGAPGKLIPELTKIASVTGAISGVGKFEKVSEDGTVTALTGDCTFNDNVVSPARISGNTLVSFLATDVIQFTITTVTAIVSTDVIGIEIAWASDETL